MPELTGMLHDLIEQSLREVDLAAIVAERRRRRRRRRVGVAAVVVVIIVVITGTVLARPTTDAKVAVGGHLSAAQTEASATRAALAQLTIVSPGGNFLGADIARGGDNLTDPRSDVTRSVDFPVTSVEASGRPFVDGTNLVLLLDSTEANGFRTESAYVVSASLQRWRSIGEASSVFASVDPDRVWIVASGSVFEESVDGTDRSQSYRLTDGRVPLAAVNGGLVTTRPGAANSGQEILQIWNPATKRVVRTFGADASLVVAQGNDVVWDSCPTVCTRRLLDLRSGLSRVLAAPAGMDWGGEAAISPDGRELAIAADAPLTQIEKESQNPNPPSGLHASIISVVNLVTGLHTQRRVSTWKGATPLEWSPDGSLVFFGRTASTVDYFNIDYANSPLRELAVSGAAGFLLARTPTVSTSSQRWEYNGLVGQDNHHSAELCVYATADDLGPDSDNCNGPLIVGWNSTAPVSAKFHLVGTYDGDEFTLTQPPSAPQKSLKGPEVIGFAPGCATPPGGWQVTNPARVSFDDYNAVTNAARAAPGFAGIWLGPTAMIGNETDFAHSVINVAFTGNLAAHRRDLAALWGGPICVVQHPVAYSKLQTITSSLFGAVGRRLGLQLLGGGPDDYADVVHVEVIAATAATRRAVDRQFGNGVVDLASVLRPVPTPAGRPATP